MQQVQPFGLSAALTTPFDSRGEIHLEQAIAHARWCLDNGCSSITLFGTTGEGSSIGSAERKAMLAGFIKTGFAADKIIIGIMQNSAQDAAAEAAHGIASGCKAILLAPPSYFKNISDDGLYDWYHNVLSMLGTAARDIILYNIPSVTAVEVTIDLVTRLRAAFGKVISGVKDSSGNWVYTEKLLAQHKDIAILIGDERNLAAGIRLGGQGAISGMANLVPDRLTHMISTGHDDPALTETVNLVLNYPVTPAVKAMLAHRTGDASWRRARAPLVTLNDAGADAVSGSFDRLSVAALA